MIFPTQNRANVKRKSEDTEMIIESYTHRFPEHKALGEEKS